MAGRSCTRLLAVSCLIFVMPASLRGQAVPFQGDRVGAASGADYAEVFGPRSASMWEAGLWREPSPGEVTGESVPRKDSKDTHSQATRFNRPRHHRSFASRAGCRNYLFRHGEVYRRRAGSEWAIA